MEWDPHKHRFISAEDSSTGSRVLLAKMSVKHAAHRGDVPYCIVLSDSILDVPIDTAIKPHRNYSGYDASGSSGMLWLSRCAHALSG